jgi:hypothetical protein
LLQLENLGTSSFLAGLAVLGCACAATAASRIERVMRGFFSMGDLKPVGKPTGASRVRSEPQPAVRRPYGRALSSTAFVRALAGLLLVAGRGAAFQADLLSTAVATHGIAFDGLGAGVRLRSASVTILFPMGFLQF